MVAKTGDPPVRPVDTALLALFRAIAAGDPDVERTVDAAPELAVEAIRVAATREDPDTYFLTTIRHYAYAGDTALHIAAAAHQRSLAEVFVAKGASVRARNRRGAEPLHYAADGSPGAAYWDPAAQRAVIEFLIAAGADPNAFDKSGVAALHRAVRTRSAAAVDALIEHGADPLLVNKSGSTPLHLAVQTTGRSNSGSDAAKEQQRLVIASLLRSGARATDVDAKGKSVEAAAVSDWIRDALGVS